MSLRKIHLYQVVRGRGPDSLNNSINKAREQLIESMRNDLKIEKS